MKAFFSWVSKAAIAGVIALGIASAVCLLYYNPGIHITNETQATDYRWMSNSFESGMTEGIAWNHTDKNGFYNDDSAPDVNMNILVMGSSNMEGTHVFAEQNTPQRLAKLTGRTVYNIGISDHSFLTCVKNLESALSVMQPTDYVIIETGSTTFSEKAIKKCLSGNRAARTSYDSGLLYHLQKVPYLKLFYVQCKKWNQKETNDEAVDTRSTVSKKAVSKESYMDLAARIREICAAHKVQPIIFYHPSLLLNADGTVAVEQNTESEEAFRSALQANDILYINMADDFVKMYDEQHVLPNGFCNTAVGFGHLNQYGNQAIAERLAAVIEEDSAMQEGQRS